MKRVAHLNAMARESYDVIIIGAGINGASAAAALAAAGARVALVDRGDLASATSSNSSNLIWGGIKYLEQGEVGLVRDLCHSRNRLMQAYPTRIREMRFLATLPRGFRKSAWMVYAGSWLYWLFGAGKTRLPALSSQLDLADIKLLNSSSLQGAVEYSDAWLVDSDARLTWDFVQSARRQGAAVATYCEARPESSSNGWSVTLQDRLSNQQWVLNSRVVINAAGPWVDPVNRNAGAVSQHHHVLSSGMHLIVPAVGDPDRVLAFFASDGRLFFVIPMGHRSCIGTTDVPVERPDGGATEDERRFILDNVNRFLALRQPLTEDDVLAERWGVRPLAQSGGSPQAGSEESASRGFHQISRRHVLDTDAERRWISVFGGKLTDCINVGEEILERVIELGVEARPLASNWFGEPELARRAEFYNSCRADGLASEWCEFQQEPLAVRWWRRYGEGAHWLLERINDEPDLLEPMLTGDDLRKVEVLYAAHHELVITLEDFVRRRTLLELTLGRAALLADPQLQVMAQWLFGDAAEQQLEAYRRQTLPRLPLTSHSVDEHSV